MNEQEQFSALVIGNELGLIDREEIIQLADQKISEQDKPPYWLIELSLNGSSSEFLRTESDNVIRSVLSIAYQKWRVGNMSDFGFRKCLRKIWGIKGAHNDWYPPLVGAEDDLSLIEDGVFKREDRLEGICNQLEKLVK